MICAADYYQFADLRDGALQFFPMCLKVDNSKKCVSRWKVLKMWFVSKSEIKLSKYVKVDIDMSQNLESNKEIICKDNPSFPL